MSFSLEKKLFLSFFSFFFFSFFFFLGSLFSGGEKKKRKNISLERSARFRSEREKNIRTTTYAREVQKERKLSPLLLLPSLFLSLLCCSFRGGEQSVSSVCDKKGVLEYFRDDRPKEKEVRKSEKEGGADSAETAQSPKGEKRFKTLVSTQNYL